MSEPLLQMRPDVAAALERARQEGRRVRVYVGGPYRAQTDYLVHRNIHQAWEIALRLWGRGYAAYCPHASTQHMGGIAAADVFLEGDLAWLHCADLIVVSDSWRQSVGTRAEVKAAGEWHIPVLCEAEADALPNW